MEAAAALSAEIWPPSGFSILRKYRFKYHVEKVMDPQIKKSEEPLVYDIGGFLKANKEFICGWGAASVNILVTFPINKVIFRQMVHNVGPLVAVRQIANEGLLQLYRGVLPPLLQKSVSVSIMFGMYDKCRKPLLESGLPPLPSKVTAAMVAGTFECVLLPFERIQTLLQHEAYYRELVNTPHAIRLLITRYGVGELYRGMIPVLWRNGPSNALFFILRDHAQATWPEQRSVAHQIANQFAIGALIGALCSTVFYPCNVLKVHMQSRMGGPYQSLFSATLEIYLSRGGSFQAFFRGVHLNYTRSCISWGVINVAYEWFKKLF